jgi:UrcA family protein
MISKTAVVYALALSGALVAGAAAAKEYDVKVAISVSTKGIDLRKPAGAQELYARIQHAALVACSYGNRVDLQAVSNPVACHDQAIGDAVRSVNSPLLTQVYLETHTTRQAAAHGIQVPGQLAAK